MSTSTPSSKHTFPFLELPSELRQKICGLCAPMDHRFMIDPTLQEPSEQAYSRTNEFNPGTLPRLLQTCRQINNEAAPLIYRSNTFEIDVYIDTRWHKLKISEPELRKEIRHITLMILCDNPEDPKDPDTIDEMWVDLLGGLSTLEIVIQHPTSFFVKNGYLPGPLNDAEWNTLLKRRLEVIKRLVPEGIEIMVDVDEDDSLTKMVEEAIPNRCTFGDLEPGYYTFQRFKSTDALDMYSGDEYSNDDGEYLDFRDPDLDDPVLQELTRLTLAAVSNIDPNDPELLDMVRWIRDRQREEQLATNGGN
ncbi:hypothetical protein NW768_002396 [Fusarium equiseti]|uniref:2EXR domain-containing protein n=1 Tax=Fusarium equiseti TaxID=61235 RepID=A0ABQ8RNK8_FUSEQ|nr:hypothetical protein NW768_002396 [Fusarium equiseti]